MCAIVSFATAFYLVSMTSIFSYYIGLCTQVKALVDDMETIILKANVNILTNRTKNIHLITKQILIEAIKFHNEIIE